MGRKIIWGVIGCASIAQVRTIPGLLLAENAELYAVASRSLEKAEAVREQFGAKKAYGSYDELLADSEVEAVYIPLPNTEHCAWVEKAAKAGKHILCEKPLAMNAEEAKYMFDVCEQEGVILMEAFAYRHSPLIQKAKSVIDAGTIGKVKYLESHLTCLLDDMTNIRMNSSLGGGAFYDMACYNISAISYLTGQEPEEVAAFKEMNEKQGVDAANVFILKYADGTLATGYSSLNSYAEGFYSIVGEKGRIDVPCNFNCRGIVYFYVSVKADVNNVELLDEEKTRCTVFCPDNYMLEIEQLGRCITDGETPLVSKEETLRNARILDRMR